MKTRKFLSIAVIGIMLGGMSGIIPFANAATEIQVTKNASPMDIHLIATGVPDTTTVEITAKGFGGTLSETLPIDVVFAIDSSGSMTTSDPSNLRLSAADSFVDKLNSTIDQGGVVSWDTGVNFAFGLTHDFTALKTNINNVDASGGTDLNVGLNGAISMLDANTRVGPSSKAIIFLTDGVGSYTPSGSPGSPADNAASKGYTIYSIALGAGASTGPLMDMASATGGQFFSSPSASNLDSIFNAILQTIVTNTSPSMVNVTETTQDYIINEASFTIPPDSITALGNGETQIVWNNVAQYVGNNDNRLSSNETFAVNFTANSNIGGNNLPVDDLSKSTVDYTNPDGTLATVGIPQAYINVQAPPVALDDFATTVEDTPVVIDVLANDTDVNNDTLTITSVSAPSDGTAVINPNGTITYTPNTDLYGGQDTFTYTISDGHGGEDTATVTVLVTEIPSTTGKVTGGGAQLDKYTNFGFNVQSSNGTTTFKGQLQYSDKLEGLNLHSVNMTSLSVDPTQTHANFKGFATINGNPGSFKVLVEDNGEPGTNDYFKIVIKDDGGSTIYMKDGTLTKGNIQIHS